MHFRNLIPIIFGRPVYQVKVACHLQEWLFSLASYLSYLP